MDVHAPLGVGIMAGNVPGDRCWRRLGRLLERYRASDLRVSTKCSNYRKELESAPPRLHLSMRW
jgi:hypothetical protein